MEYNCLLLLTLLLSNAISNSESSLEGLSSSLGSSFTNQHTQCIGMPTLPSNGRVKCVGDDECEVSCFDGYAFPNDETFVKVECSNGQWITKNSDLDEFSLMCEPVCLPNCLNNGICIEPGECKCPENYMGASCELEEKFCYVLPSLPANSRRSCTQSLCTVTCMKGYKFLNENSPSMDLLCKDGNWIPEKEGIESIPDCERKYKLKEKYVCSLVITTCEPNCENGGYCLDYNVCHCPINFRGSNCQYSVERCSPKKLNFNGGYNCTSYGDVISCKLFCPKGATFDFEPTSNYECNFATGEFLPQELPKCSFEHFQFVRLNETWIDKSNDEKIKNTQADIVDSEEIIEIIVKKIIKIKKTQNNSNESLFASNQTQGV